jgi:short-subunit dehydrogenase
MARPFPAQVAVITGASSGLGAELARQLAREGLAVGLIARREAELAALAREIASAGGRSAFALADVTEPGPLLAAIDRLTGELGPVDLLVANAGMGLSTPAVGFSARDVETLLRVNVLGAANAIEAVLPRMIERRRGQIVGVSSLAGYRGFPGSAGYCASKAALTVLLEGLRVDLRGTGVVVTTIHPGFVRTPMTAGQARRQPFLMEPAPAVRLMVRGIRRGARRVDFPWAASLVMGAARLLPSPIFDRVAALSGVEPATDPR